MPDPLGGSRLLSALEPVRPYLADVSGLKVYDLEEGRGKEVKLGDKVSVSFCSWQ